MTIRSHIDAAALNRDLERLERCVEEAPEGTYADAKALAEALDDAARADANLVSAKLIRRRATTRDVPAMEAGTRLGARRRRALTGAPRRSRADGRRPHHGGLTACRPTQQRASRPTHAKKLDHGFEAPEVLHARPRTAAHLARGPRRPRQEGVTAESAA
jgi:hypothetical protein